MLLNMELVGVRSIQKDKVKKVSLLDALVQAAIAQKN